MKINRNFNEFTDFESLELKVPTFCFVTGCVSARRDRRYVLSLFIETNPQPFISGCWIHNQLEAVILFLTRIYF
jgi:hypothetical protein